MKRKKLKIRLIKTLFATAVFLVALGFFVLPARAEEQGAMPDEYADFYGSVDGDIIDKLPEGVTSDEKDGVNGAAAELVDPNNILNMLIDALGVGETSLLLGAGRQTKEDALDMGAGVILHKKTGDNPSTAVRRSPSL